jgi:FAD/FMN-containing dehydrogenase
MSHFDYLRSRTRGPVLEPDSSEYDSARRCWNGRFDRRPRAILRCEGTADVVAGVNFARKTGLLLAVKGGGHDYAGNCVCDDGLVLDLSAMKGIRVDPSARRAWVEPGVIWREFDREAQAFGLATTGGTVSTVGVSGFTLGGGTGYLARRHGLGLDNLVSAEVVTANGERVRASGRDSPDLYWAIRGGGGNFGIVVSFEFRLHPVGPEVLAGQVLHQFEDAGAVLRFYRDFMTEASDEMTCYAFFFKIPPVAAFPETLHGKPAVSLVVAHVGRVAEGEEAFQGLLDFGRPILGAIQPMPYTAAQQMFDEGMPKGIRWYSRAHYLDGLPDSAIDILLSHVGRLPGPFSVAYLEPLGGAIGRMEAASTAFPHRNAAYGLHIFPGWTDPAMDEAARQWARLFHDEMATHATGGVYVNLLGEDESDRIPAAYGGNYDRLVRIKKRYDPENIFRMNHNIPPGP